MSGTNNVDSRWLRTRGERRRQSRLRAPLYAWYRQGRSTFQRSAATGLTETGGRLLTDRILPSGTDLYVNLKLPEESLVTIRARVVWSRQEGAHILTGVRFEELNPLDRRRLSHWYQRQARLEAC